MGAISSAKTGQSQGNCLHAAQETLGFAVLLPFLEVAPDPVLETPRLADIEYLFGCVFEEIDAR